MIAVSFAQFMPVSVTRADEPVEARPANNAQEDHRQRPSARERLTAFEAAGAQGITPETNAAEHLMVYLTHPDLRDHRFRERLRATGIDTPLAEIPVFTNWLDYLMQTGESRESRQQYDAARWGLFDRDEAPDVVQWLESTGPALDALREAASLPHFSLPITHADWPEATYLKQRFGFTMLSHEFESIVSAYLVRCHYYLSIGDNETALADLIAADRLAKLLTHFLDLGLLEDCFDLSYSLNHTLELLLANGTFSQQDLALLLAQWQQPITGLTGAAVLDQWERLWLIDYLERVDSGDEEESSFFLVQILSMGGPVNDDEKAGWDWMLAHDLFDTRRAIARIDARYDELIGSIEVADLAGIKVAAEELERSYFDRLGAMEYTLPVVEGFYQERVLPEGMTSETYTDLIVDVMLVLLMHPNRILDASVLEFSARANRRLGIAAIALARYRLDHDAYPETLDGLVPEYLVAVPSDPFLSGEAIRYRVDEEDGGAALHCVGLDQVNDGGEGDDPSFVLE